MIELIVASAARSQEQELRPAPSNLLSIVPPIRDGPVVMNVDSTKPYIFTIRGLLSVFECRELVERIEREGPTAAPITTLQGPRIMPAIRNNERVMFEDEALANLLFD